MKSLIVLLALSFSLTILADECYLPIGSSWVQFTDANQKLRLDLPNDRNLYISYYDEKNDVSVELSHKIYSCDGKLLYVVTEDQYVVLFAAMEEHGKSGVTLHFVGKYQHGKMLVRFQRLH